MKNKFLLSFCVIFLSIVLPLSAQTEISQMVFPKKIFVGDTAELRVTFNSNVDFFPNEENLDEKTLIVEKLPFSLDNEEFTLTKAVIQRNGAFYAVVLTFMPWKAEMIDFPEFDLISAVFGTVSSVPFVINPEPFEVSSVLQKNAETSLSPLHAPLLAPGTVYILYACIIVFILLVAFVVQLVLRWQSICEGFKERKIKRLYNRNARGTLRQFRKLEKNSSKINDISFCLAVQRIFRHYLSVRFGKSFDVLSSDQIIPVFEELTAGTMSDFFRENVFSVTELFRRADYIRFAHDSLDSKRKPEETYSASLQDGERSVMIENSRTIIKAFETGGENA